MRTRLALNLLIVLVGCVHRVGPLYCSEIRSVVLIAQARRDPYETIRSTLYSEIETPECEGGHLTRHLSQIVDEGREVFALQLHVDLDDDRCQNSDRQRVEMKTSANAQTPNYLLGSRGDRMMLKWLFKLPLGFQVSHSFTHLHQLKDGDVNAPPMITLTARKTSRGERMQISHVDDASTAVHVLQEVDLGAFQGEWVDVTEEVVFHDHGAYRVTIKRVRDGQELLHYASENIDLWREGALVMRPKWGLYRSLEHREDLRDETVLFDRLCLTKSADQCH